MTLQEAQQIIATDWFKYYRDHVEVGMEHDATGSRRWQHPWLRVERVIRAIREERWCNAWPTTRATLKRAMGERSQIRRAGWFS